MAATTPGPAAGNVLRLTKEKLFGTPGRWRRFGEPMPAGTPDASGKPDYGIFGPGSMAWEVILHPSTIVFLHAAQGLTQTRCYKPIVAGLRDRDPLTRKALAGKMTAYDSFDRASRNAGMHAPMWLGDTKTAQSMAQHLHKYHRHVAGDVIDVGQPELGGYAAATPREAMWAAITEIHPMLWAYEAFAFRNGKLPHRLKPEQRDQYIAEMAAYLRLLGADENEIPHNMAQLRALYKKYEKFFRHSETINILPENGEDFVELMKGSIKKNFNLSYLKAVVPLAIMYELLGLPVLGALSGEARKSMGFGPWKSFGTLLAKKLFLPLIWLVQRPSMELYFLKRMWGPDATQLIMSARKLHREALAQRNG